MHYGVVHGSAVCVYSMKCGELTPPHLHCASQPRPGPLGTSSALAPGANTVSNVPGWQPVGALQLTYARRRGRKLAPGLRLVKSKRMVPLPWQLSAPLATLVAYEGPDQQGDTAPLIFSKKARGYVCTPAGLMSPQGPQLLVLKV